METTKRTIVGLAMLLAPLLLLVGFSIHPPEPRDGAQLLGVIANDAGRWNAAHVLFALSMVLAIPATSGLMELLEHRGGAKFGLIGGSLAVVGVIFLTLFIGVELAMSAIARSVPVEEYARIEPAMQALIDFDGPLPVVFVGLSLNLGLFVLGVGLISARTVPRWTGVAIEVAALVLVGGLFNNPIGAVGAAVLLVGLGAIGLGVLKSVR